MGFSCFYGAEKVLNFDSVIWVGTLLSVFYCCYLGSFKDIRWAYNCPDITFPRSSLFVSPDWPGKTRKISLFNKNWNNSRCRWQFIEIS